MTIIYIIMMIFMLIFTILRYVLPILLLLLIIGSAIGMYFGIRHFMKWREIYMMHTITHNKKKEILHMVLSVFLAILSLVVFIKSGGWLMDVLVFWT